MTYLVLLALAIAALSLSMFVHDRVREAEMAQQHLRDGFAALQARADATNISLVRENDQLEREIEQVIWSSPRQLRGQKKEVVERLEGDLQNLREREKYGVSDDSVRISIALEKASVERIDKRLNALDHSTQVASQRCLTCGTLPLANGAAR
jgi:hypothetical protein